MRGRWMLAGMAWLAVAVVTAVAGLTAVSLLGNGLFASSGSQRPLTDREVERQLASLAPSGAAAVGPAESNPPASTGPSGAASTPAAQATSRLLTTPGGSVVAACMAGRAVLRSWTPAQGFHTDGVERGPAATAWVKFEGGDDELTVLVTCAAGVPSARVVRDDH